MNIEGRFFIAPSLSGPPATALELARDHAAYVTASVVINHVSLSIASLVSRIIGRDSRLVGLCKKRQLSG